MKLSANQVAYYRWPDDSVWRNHAINDQAIFSHRVRAYDQSNFPEQMHSHSYYEIVVCVAGGVRYIYENKTLLPERGSIAIAPPHAMHTAQLVKDSVYDRYVIYMDSHALSALGGDHLLDFLHRRDSLPFLSLAPDQTAEMFQLLARVEEAFSGGEDTGRVLALSYAIQLFHLLNGSVGMTELSDEYLPKNILDVKKYIDENFATIQSTTEIAENFFYSREYVSRLFKQYFKLPIHDYLARRRVGCAKMLLERGASVSDACYQSGFRSMTSFIRAFTALNGMPPSAYRRNART